MESPWSRPPTEPQSAWDLSPPEGGWDRAPGPKAHQQTVSEEVEDGNAIGEDAVVENAVADIMSNE